MTEQAALPDDAVLGDDEDESQSDDAGELTFAPQGGPPSPPLNSVAGRSAWAPHIPEDAPLEDQDLWESASMHTGSGWVHADQTVSRHIWNAALTAARFDGVPVERLNCNWHRPDDHDMQPMGYNVRGDLAPPPVHAALTRLLFKHGETSSVVHKLAHGTADKIWFLHSRSRRLAAAIKQAFDFLPAPAHDVLADLMRMHPLKDLRLVAATVDPREKVVYGVTLDSPAAPRQWREIFYAPGVHPDWESDPGGVAGSSPDTSGLLGSQGLQYAPLSPSDEDRRARRWADRRTRRFARAAQLANERAQQAQIAAEEILARQERAETLREILERGMAAQRGPLPLTETQSARAWYDHRVQPAATDADLMPPTP